MVIRRTDSDEGWVNRELGKIRAEIRELRSAKRVITNLTIPGSGGDVTTGGIVAIGTQPQGDRGMRFIREDGTIAFRLNKALGPTDPQSWSLKDRAGSDVVAENTLGIGLGKPFLELGFQPYSATPGTAVTCGPYGWERTTSAGSWTTLFVADTKAQNYFLDFKFGAFCSDGTTAGEVQIVDLGTGIPLPGFLSSAAWVGSIAAGTTTPTVLDPTPDQVVSTVGAGIGSMMRLGVQVRVTAGTGSITLAVAQAIGG